MKSAHVSRQIEPRPNRFAFTLIELLAVIVVIGILVSLILAATGGARAAVNTAEVVAEVSQFNQALEAFKNEYGNEYPPSRITLFEDGTAMASAPAWTKTHLQKHFGGTFRFDVDRDFNGDGDTSDTIELNGSECLVFFLGGMLSDELSAGGVPTGFSKNPQNPFARGGSSRKILYNDFDPGRFTDLDGDGMPEYKDPLSGQVNPYLYLRGYKSRGYEPSEDSKLDGTNAIANNVYLEAASKPYKTNSFQLISPGLDGSYGNSDPDKCFGLYTEEGADSQVVGDRQDEADNITNFSGGRLRG